MTVQIPAAILWDMDGTLIDTEPAWVSAEQTLLSEWSLTMRPEDVTDWVGIGLWDLAHIFRERGVQLTPDAIVQRLTDLVNEHVFAADLAWRPGARELAQAVTEAGIPNVLVTMSTRGQAEAVIARLPKGTFTGIVAGEDARRPKPYPDPYVQGAAVVGAHPAQCVAIEDSVIGSTSAHSSGAFVIGVPNLVDLRDAPVHHLADSLKDLTVAHLVTLFQTKGIHD